MEQHIVAETVRRNGIVDVVSLVGVPVLRQFLGTEYQNRLVAVLVILYHSKSGKGLAEAHAVRKDTAVVFFQFIDNGESRIPLEIVEHIPNTALLESCGLIGKNVLRDVVQELPEDVVEREKVDEVRSVLTVCRCDVLNDNIRHVLQSVPVRP